MTNTTKQKHTPGTWYVDGGNIFSEKTDHNCAIAKVLLPRLDTPASANARLIAAAPELLEACKVGLSYTYNGGTQQVLNDRKKIKQAIAKAEGVEK